MDYEGEPWLSGLNTTDLGILLAMFEVPLMTLPRAHPDNTEHDLWHEICDLMGDLHASWQEAFLRERI